MEPNKNKVITRKSINEYAQYLYMQEKSPTTIKKYSHDLEKIRLMIPNGKLNRKILLEWKEHLTSTYAVSSINTMLAALNGYLDHQGWNDLKMKPLKKQKIIFCPEEQELTQNEYVRLVKTARQDGNYRLELVLQTICGTGIRVSELCCITVEAVKKGRAEVNCKGKQRVVLIPQKLCLLLTHYFKKNRQTAGPIFVTRSGRPLDRSNIWREMKALCERAKVNPDKVFPHNLRHLFARTYYSLEKDLSRLADLLGHTNVNTTRIYTRESGTVHARQMERMHLIIT